MSKLIEPTRKSAVQLTDKGDVSRKSKRYEIDFDKVKTLKDVIDILEAMQITFPETGYEDIRHFLKESTMTDWRKHANLFANGKFEVKHPNWEGTFKFGLESEFLQECIGNLDVKIEDCTLIARRIEDMTDEEVKKFAKLYWDFEGCEVVSAKIENGTCFIIQDSYGGRGNASFDLRDMRMPQTIYLLSIGVYPFEWPDEGIIDKKEEETEKISPYDRLTDVQKAFYNGYDKGYEAGLNEQEKENK